MKARIEYEDNAKDTLNGESVSSLSSLETIGSIESVLKVGSFS